MPASNIDDILSDGSELALFGDLGTAAVRLA